MGSEWSADPTSDFYGLYQSYGANYNSFISAVYQREFGFAPSAQNLQNLINDVPGVQALLAGGTQGAATPIQVVGGIYGYLLYVGQTYGIGQYATSANAFLQAAAAGTVTYGPELTVEFPPGTLGATASTASSLSTADASNVISLTGSNQLIDPGFGSFTIQFLAGSDADTLVLHSGGTDLVSGFNPTSDMLDFASLLSEAGVDLNGSLALLANYVTITDHSGSALVIFDATGHGGGSTVAALQGLGNSVTGLSTLIADGAVRIT